MTRSSWLACKIPSPGTGAPEPVGIEAVNSRFQRAEIGHELAERASFGHQCGAVYRITGQRVDISVYSIGEFDVSALAGGYGGGGHRNAAGFSVPLSEWTENFA